MAGIKTFEDIIAWQEARKLVKDIYMTTDRNNKFSKDFGFKSQIRSAAVSIPSNIAEGFERNGNKEFLHFLSIAKGSAGEVRSQLYLAFDLDYISEAEHESLKGNTKRVSSLIHGLMNHLKTTELNGPKFRRNTVG